MSKDQKNHEDFVRDVIAGLKAMGIIIYGERVAVVRDPEIEKIGLIHVPEEGKRKEPRGIVVGQGLGLLELEDSITAGLAVGDHVMYTKYNPIDFKITLPDGQVASLELMHVSDLYIGWRQ